MSNRERILREFELFSLGTGGIGSWLTEETDDIVFDRLANITQDYLTQAQFNQLLVLGKEAPVSEGFFEYYFLSDVHPTYKVTKLPFYKEDWLKQSEIIDLAHLKWGLYRLYVDGLLFFGSVRNAFRALRNLPREEINEFFLARAIDTSTLVGRGPALPLASIPKDDRYLISEMACKSFGDTPTSPSALKGALLAAYKDHIESGGGAITIKQLLHGTRVSRDYKTTQEQLVFSADEGLDSQVSSQEELEHHIASMTHQFLAARTAALGNTKKYLSMVGDLDVYVATSMRTRDDFRKMGDTCDALFGTAALRDLNVRYFDPTLSSAQGHEDKGLIECLMVKAAKLLVYYAGEKESYGKDAEAAMALSLGKPVVFLCDSEQRSDFYRDVHPLSRLIQFSTGVAVGAMATDDREEASALIHRILTNDMEYELDHITGRRGYLRLREKLTKSVVRLQTNDLVLNEAFWNLYHAGAIRE